MCIRDRTYTPAEVEARWYQRWLDDKCFEADPARVSETRPAYSIVIPCLLYTSRCV